MSIQYHDPRPVARRAIEAYLPRLAAGEAPVIGLLANGFPDAAAFLAAVESALAAAWPQAHTRHYAKRGASMPAEPALVARMVAECDAVVTAYGH